MVDDLAFSGGKGSGSYDQVLDLITGQEISSIPLDIAPSIFGRNILHALHVFGFHCLAPEVAAPQKPAVFIDLIHAPLESAPSVV